MNEAPAYVPTLRSMIRRARVTEENLNAPVTWDELQPQFQAVWDAYETSRAFFGEHGGYTPSVEALLHLDTALLYMEPLRMLEIDHYRDMTDEEAEA